MKLPKLLNCLLLFLSIAVLSPATAQQSATEEFDHFSTGFPLSGAHTNLDCGTCHTSGVFEGTPTTCSACHNGIRAVGKPINHVRSINTCDDCHTTFSMQDVRFDHGNIIDTCRSCHDGTVAPDKKLNHVPTADDCGECHRTITFSNAIFSHANINSLCTACHLGQYATPKHANHIPTPLECNVCHTTRSWSEIIGP